MQALRIIALRSGWYSFIYRGTPEFRNPDEGELASIETDLIRLGVTLEDYNVDIQDFAAFCEKAGFPSHYHGGVEGGVWHEKLLEHFIADDLLGLSNFTPEQKYVDVAACSSPWAKLLREKHGVSAFAIDLEVPDAYGNLDYYMQQDATATDFAESSVDGASLQCAYEMFRDNDDEMLINEVARILSPGGKLVIVPLYMHTHYCAYATPEYWGRGYTDPDAEEYVNLTSLGVPSSRKYDAATLDARVLQAIRDNGMNYRLHVLRNKEEVGHDVYCHFILEITK
jgi:hypothetical protein|tara:strand:+ start:4478 stop:5326 length:849 start_codon:yes stop_codon:yes gene_type:complete